MGKGLLGRVGEQGRHIWRKVAKILGDFDGDGNYFTKHGG